MLEDPSQLAEIKLLIQFYSANAKVFYNLIEYFEESLGITHLAYNRIYKLWNILWFNAFSVDFGEAVENIIKENDMDEKYWHYEFKQLYLKAWNKLDQIIKEHECTDFLEAVRVFDPSQLSSLSKPLEYCQKCLSDLNSEDPIVRKQFKNYLKNDLLADEPNETDPVKFWRTMNVNCPELSRIAIMCLNTPVSSVDVERSFS